MRIRRLFIAVTAVAAAVRLAHLAFIAGHPYHEFWSVWKESDMYQYVAWARHLAAGDWLDTATFRAWFAWQAAIAEPATWNAWYGEHVYYQPPLYPYLVAAVLRVTGSLDFFRLLQLMTGALNCGLLALLAERVFTRSAGWLAGLAAAVYAPFILYDAEILRGTVVMTTQLLMLIALVRRRPAWAGAAFGVGYLAEPSILLFGPMAIAWIAWTGGGAEARTGRWERWKPAAAFAGCAALSLAPLVARNLLVSAPLLSSTTRGPLAFVMGNAPDAQPAGAVIPGSTAAILAKSGYRMGGTIAETLRQYRGRYLPLLEKQLLKLRCLWSAYEVPDNPSFYYAARVSPVIRYGLRFLPVAAFGLVGLGLVLPRIRREPDAALLVLFLAAAHALFLLAHVVSRYRQLIVIPCLLLGAYALVTAAHEGIRSRRCAGIVAAAAGIALLLPWGPPEGYGYLRIAEYKMASTIYVERGATGRAVEEMRSLIRQVEADPVSTHLLPGAWYQLGLLQTGAGDHAGAAASYREALRADPEFGEAFDALNQAEAAAAAGRGKDQRR